MDLEGAGGGPGGATGLLQQILSLKLVPRVGNETLCPNSTALCSFPGTGPAPGSWGLVSSENGVSPGRHCPGTLISEGCAASTPNDCCPLQITHLQITQCSPGR